MRVCAGLFCHIPDWFGFVKASQEFIDAVARPRCQQPGDSPPLKLFGMGAQHLKPAASPLAFAQRCEIF